MSIDDEERRAAMDRMRACQHTLRLCMRETVPRLHGEERDCCRVAEAMTMADGALMAGWMALDNLGPE